MTANVEAEKHHRPRWKKKRWRIGVLLALLIVCFYTIPNFPTGPFTLYGDMTEAEKAAPIPYTRLADGNTELGYTPKFKPTDKSVRKFSGVRDCLVRSEAEADLPDLRLINWNKIVTDADAETCLWWIFLSLSEPSRVQDWIDFQGFQRPEAVEGLTPSPDRIVRGGEIDAKVQKLKFPARGILYRLGNAITVYKSTIYVEWNSNGELVDVSYLNFTL